jgi:hypothetical protein
MDDDDVIVDSASSGTTYGFVESAPNTPSPETSEFDLRQARRIEREVSYFDCQIVSKVEQNTVKYVYTGLFGPPVAFLCVLYGVYHF